MYSKRYCLVKAMVLAGVLLFLWCFLPQGVFQVAEAGAAGGEGDDNSIFFGDVNGDGKIAVSDAILVLRHLVLLESLDEEAYRRARVSGRPELGIHDAVLILQRIVGVIDRFPVERTTTGEPINLKYTFEEGKEGWDGCFTDLPVDYEEDIYDLQFGHADWPEDLGQPGKALMISSINRSDDIFMYVKRKIGTAEGIEPNTTYLLKFDVEFATNAPAGAVGVGGPPGEAVWVKVGAGAEEPVRVECPHACHPFWVLNLDKGRQNDDGEHAMRIGDVAKEGSADDDFSYALKNLNNNDFPLLATSCSEGNLWIFVGTDSGFEGKTTLYYTKIEVALEKVINE